MIKLRELAIRALGFEADRISLTIRPGEVHALIGPSGAGKTLILETIAGLYKPHRGSVLIDDLDVTVSPPEQRGFAYVPQDTSLFPHLTVEENILYGLKVTHQEINGDRQQYIRHLTGRLNISHLLDRLPPKLSGGERQRVALARALAVRPRLLLLDEPISALDPAIREETCYLFKELHREFLFSALLVTHDFEEAFFLSDVFSILIDGRIRQTGKRKEVLYHPRDVSVARFLGVSNLFKGRIIEVTGDEIIIYWEESGRTIIARRTFRDHWVTKGAEIFWGVRPEDVHIVKEEKKEDDENIFTANLLAAYSGKNIYNLITRLTKAGTVIKIVLRDTVLQRLKISPGDVLQIYLVPDTIILLPSESNMEIPTLASTTPV